MRLSRSPLAVILLNFVFVAALPGQETLSLANEKGAGLQFVDRGEGGWQLAQLQTPVRAESWNVVEGDLEFSAGNGLDVLSGGWKLTDSTPTTAVFEQDAPLSGLSVRRVFSFGPASHIVRIETWLRSVDDAKLLHRATALALRIEGETFRVTGPAPASFPVFGENLFAGIEDVCAESRAKDDTVTLWQTPDISVGKEWQLIAAAVIGWHAPREALFLPGESRTRDAFLQYLDTISIKPQGINLHSDTWWTLPMPFTETDVLRDIEALRAGFFERTGMFFDTYALDLGWSDPQTLWKIDQQNFPDGLQAIAARLAEMKCRMGMWVSPSSGYPPGLDNRWLDSQGYEMTPVGEGEKVACFALGGRYQREFTETIVGYAKDYSLGHVIFDGLVHQCNEAEHLHATGIGASYAIAAGFRDVMDRLRQVNPKIVLEPLSCGHPPSPWWNMHSPFLLGPAGDDVPFGRVPCPDWTESLTSARDIAYRARQPEWLVRTQALETFDIIVQSPGVFQNMAVMAVGRGRWFMSANVRPELMKPTDWDFLAALVRWQRHNEKYLVDARQFGGSPEKREAYGYVFHHAEKDLFCIRNPWMEERAIQLPARVREGRELRMIYPRRATVARLEPDQEGPTLVLGPYETLFLETVAATEQSSSAAPEALPQAVVASGDAFFTAVDPEDARRGFLYSWNGSVALPAISDGELKILVEGPPDIAATTCVVWVNGEEVTLARRGSAGQFGAAVDASPESWTWFIASLPPGEMEIEVMMDVPFENAAVGIYVTGAVEAASDETESNEPAFPVFQPRQRPWSQTLQPLKAFVSRVVDDVSS